MQKVKNFLIYFTLICFALAFARHFFDAPIVSGLFVVFIVVLAYKLNLPKFGLILFVCSFLLRLLVILFIDSPITSDYVVMYDAAREIVNGNFGVAASLDYMLRWGYQMGYTLFMALLMYISDGALLIKIVNCLFTSLIVLFIYLICCEITDKKIARVVSVAYMFFPFPLLFNTVLSNQHISSFMFLLAIYLLISNKTKKMNDILKFVLIALCLAIGNIIRPEAIVFNVAILLFVILTVSKKDLKRMIRNLLVMFGVYFFVTSMASFVATQTGVSPSGFGNKEPLWKIAVGFNPESKGDYNMELAGKFIGLERDKQIDIIYDYTLGSLFDLPSLFLYKAQHFWLDGDLRWSISYLDGSYVTIFDREVPFEPIKSVIVSLNYLYIYLIFILTVVAIFVNRKKMDDKQLLFMIILLVYFGVYLLIECTPRYAYTAQIFMFLMSAYAIEFITQKLPEMNLKGKLKEKLRNKKE